MRIKNNDKTYFRAVCIVLFSLAFTGCTKDGLNEFGPGNATGKVVIDWNLAHMELNSWRNNTTLEWDRLLLCAAISFVLIALMIAIGIGIPARKAMKVQPAEALHDD